MESFKVKVLAAGLALASSSVAFGAIDPGNLPGDASGNGELFLTVYDNRDVSLGGQRSYTRDLGTAMNDWVDNAGVLAPGKNAPGFSQTFATDATWATFISGMSAGDVAGLKWDVYSLDTTGNGSHGRRFLTTTNDDISPNNMRPTLSGINGGFSSIFNYVNANNNLIPAPGNSDYAADISVIAGPGDGQALALIGKGSNLLGAAPFNTTADIGQTLNFFYLTANGTGPLNRALYDQFDSAAGASTFQLAANGTLLYSAAPVPEAETWAMFAAGLLGVGAIARRRMAV